MLFMILAGEKIAPSIKSITRENVIYTFIIKSEILGQI